MPVVTARELLTAGAHFGHRTSRWNPRMAPYIFGRRNKIHIINLRETIKGMIEARAFLRAVAAAGRQVLYVGTKRQAREAVSREGARVGMPYVAERWLGGTLTNLRTIRERVKFLEELERVERDGTLNLYSKKEVARHRREKRKILRNLEGIREMSALPGALIVVDPKREHIAIAEAAKLGVPVIAVLDTDCDPTSVAIPIPANDDAMRSVDLLVGRLTDGVAEGKKEAGRLAPPPATADAAPRRAGGRGRARAAPKGAKETGLKKASPRGRAPAPAAGTPAPAAGAPAPAVDTPTPAAGVPDETSAPKEE